MTTLNVRSRIVTRVARAFYERDIQSSCLAAAMFSKMLIEKHAPEPDTIVLKRGYVTMGPHYWGHFWLENEEPEEPEGGGPPKVVYPKVVYDPGTLLWFLKLSREQKNCISERHLVKAKPTDGKCLDDDGFSVIQDACYNECLSGRFWINLQKIAGDDIARGMCQLYDALDNDLQSSSI